MSHLKVGGSVKKGTVVLVISITPIMETACLENFLIKSSVNVVLAAVDVLLVHQSRTFALSNTKTNQIKLTAMKGTQVLVVSLSWL